MIYDLPVILGYITAISWIGFVLVDLLGLRASDSDQRRISTSASTRPILVSCGCGRKTPFELHMAGRFGRCHHCHAQVEVSLRPRWASAES